jgi:protein-S-isoprenylcysteine O-methyltransferase Ste14
MWDVILIGIVGMILLIWQSRSMKSSKNTVQRKADFVSKRRS